VHGEACVEISVSLSWFSEEQEVLLTRLQSYTLEGYDLQHGLIDIAISSFGQTVARSALVKSETRTVNVCTCSITAAEGAVYPMEQSIYMYIFIQQRSPVNWQASLLAI
jgi:hypothetical protein